MKSRFLATATSVGILISLALIGCKPASLYQYGAAKNSISSKSIYADMERAATWQMDSIRHRGWRHPIQNWTSAALYTGLLAWQDVSSDSATLAFLTNIADSLQWKLKSGPDRYHADNYCIGQLYCRLYELHNDPVRIADLKALADTLKNRPHTESLEW
jgi:hypothetical protein